MVILPVSFQVEHLRLIRNPDHRALPAFALIEERKWDEVRKTFGSPWGMTFLDANSLINGELTVIGCFSIAEQTNGCWAVCDDVIITSRKFRSQKIAIARACMRVLDAREAHTGNGVWATTDGTRSRDEKFLRTIGFIQANDGKFYRNYSLPQQGAS